MPRVLVLGSSGYDLTIRLPRLPREGETLLGGHLHTGPGGKGANQAIAARRAGAEVALLSAFGDDDFGRIAADNLRAEGVDLSITRVVAGSANQVALIFVGESGSNLIGVAPGASEHLAPADIDALPGVWFAAGGLLLASLEIPLATVRRALERGRAGGMTTIVNPAPAAVGAGDPGFLALVDVLTPNEEEAASLSGVSAADRAGAERAATILRDRGARSVIVTRGEAGCVVATGSDRWHIPAPKVRAIDTVGAGDAFNGALAASLANGNDLPSAARWACAAGSIAVTRPGAQGALPRRHEIDEALAHP